MTGDEAVVAAACARFRLSPAASRAHGALGQRAGHGEGSSVEFHDFRQYVPGDDPRHVDWAAYGRTGELTVRLFQREVEPHVDVVVDGSRSMALVDGEKATLARQLPGFFYQGARLDGASARLHCAGARVETLSEARQLRFDAATTALEVAPEQVVSRLRRGGLTCVVSDFLWRESAARTLTALGERSAQLAVVMVLGPWERAPTLGAAEQLVDSESGHELSTTLSAQVLERYLGRLRRLQADVSSACRRLGARCAVVTAEGSLQQVLAEQLLPAGVVQPR